MMEKVKFESFYCCVLLAGEMPFAPAPSFVYLLVPVDAAATTSSSTLATTAVELRKQARRATRSYIGATVNLTRRLKQHNAGRRAGGARYTAGSQWTHAIILGGMSEYCHALSMEKRWQKSSRGKHTTRLVNMYKVATATERKRRKQPPPLVYASIVRRLCTLARVLVQCALDEENKRPPDSASLWVAVRDEAHVRVLVVALAELVRSDAKNDTPAVRALSDCVCTLDDARACGRLAA